MSTHNVIHESQIVNKGYALTALTIFWMEELKKLGVKTHLVAHGKEIYNFLPKGTYPADLHLRGIIVKKVNVILIEFIFRNYMAGSLWKDFYSKGKPNPYGVELPEGLKLMSRFAGTIFTPTEKSDVDDPMNSEYVQKIHFAAYALALKAYEFGRAFAREYGIEIIDGKFEIGIDPVTGEVVLIDECLTPDSCRFVAEKIVEGKDPAWLDKQFIREEAERIWAGGEKVALTFSPEVCQRTSEIYADLVKRLTGKELETI